VITRLSAVLVACAVATGCSQSGDAPAATERTASASAPKTANDLAQNSAHRTLKIPGENFVLTVDYFLTAYDATKWQTLAAKDVNVSAYVRPSGAGPVPQVMLGSFEARTQLRAVDPALDALPVATTDDRPPSAVAGYVMSAAYPYSAVVPVDGYSTTLVDRWRYLAGDQALTEEGLVRAGVYANRLTFSYGLLVKDTTGYHKRSVVDSLTVPVVAG
jgi:hypothetical protein